MAPESLLVFCNVTNKIRKRTDTDVAFTQEYFKVSYPHGNVITLSMGSGYPRTHTKEEITSSLYFELLILTGVYKPIAPVIRALSDIRMWRITRAQTGLSPSAGYLYKPWV